MFIVNILFMVRIIKENGMIWEEEIQTLDGNHRKRTLIGFYDEEEKKVEEKPKNKRQKKSEA